MSEHLVDTDWIIQVLRGDSDAIQTLEELAEGGLAVSLITYGELFQGAFYARDAEQAQSLLREVLAGKDIVSLTEPIMERFAIVRGQLTRNQRQQVGDMDLLIAATALQYDLTLVTFNVRDFQLIPGLRLYSPRS